MKQAPDDIAAPTISTDGSRIRDFLQTQVKKIRCDFADRSDWLQAQEHWISRRLCTEWRNPTTPWPGPYSRDTEILTRCGWRRIDSVQIGDIVLSRNDKTKVAEWVPVEATPSAFYESLIEFDNQGVSLRVSPDHTMVYESRNRGVRRCRADRTDQLWGWMIPLTSEWDGLKIDKIDGFDAGDFMEFLGWYVSEGWTFKSGTIGIGQSKSANPDKCGRLESLFDRMGLRWNRTKSNEQYLVSCKKFSRRMRAELSGLGDSKHKRLPHFVFSLCRGLLARLLESLILGDGTSRLRPGRRFQHKTYFTSSKALADDVQALVQLCGQRARIGYRGPRAMTIRGRKINGSGQFEVYVLNDRHCKYQNLRRSVVPYHDTAYCVTVKNHAVYVRRNGKACWCGNSSNIVLPLIDKECDELKPQYINMITAAKPPVTAEATLPIWQKKARNVELLFEWLVHHGSPRFIEETILAVDDCLQHGRGIVKSYWLYETRTTPTYLTTENLPKELRRLIVTQRDARHANSLFANPASVASGAVLITRNEFDSLRDQIRLVVKKAFDLDDDEPRDQKAIDAVMAWFRSGAKGPLSFESRDVVCNVPAIRAISPLDLIVPVNATDDPEEHERITEVMYFTESQLKALVIDRKVDRNSVDALFDNRRKALDKSARKPGTMNSQRQLVDQEASAREGLGGQAGDDLYEIWKVSTRFSTTENGPEKKVIAMIPAECPDAALSVKVLARPTGKWGYHTFTFEHNKRRWYAARGIAEKIDDLDAEMTAQHRGKLNRMAIVNSPTFKVLTRNAQQGFQWWPGQQLVTNNPANDWVPIQHQPLDVSFDNEVQYLRTWVESLLGHPDYGITGNSTMNEARTATEINSINAMARQSLSMRGLLFKRAFDGVWKEFFDLWIAHGPKEVSISVMGDEPIVLTKEQLQGNFLLTCTGTIGSSDPAAEAQKAQNMVGLLAELAPILGDKYELDMGEVVLNWLEKADIRLMKRALRERSPEEIEELHRRREAAMAMQRSQELTLAQAGQKPQAAPAGGGPRKSGGLPPRLAMAAMGGSR